MNRRMEAATAAWVYGVYIIIGACLVLTVGLVSQSEMVLGGVIGSYLVGAGAVTSALIPRFPEFKSARGLLKEAEELKRLKQENRNLLLMWRKHRLELAQLERRSPPPQDQGGESVGPN